MTRQPTQSCECGYEKARNKKCKFCPPKNNFEITDRYKALGIPYPNPKTICEGQCEGTGYVPHCMSPVGELSVARQEGDDILDVLWEEAHAKPHKEECDGFHFVKCPNCKGSGKKP